jgi:Methyltransferase domain
LYAIDSWSGNQDESEHHVSVGLARERDVYSQFLTNTRLLTNGNIIPIRTDCHEFLASWRRPVKFAHIDASHDYRSVKRIINALAPHVVPGGVLCGDDFLTADASRQDLDGGVERAVRELLPGFEQIHNLWLWRKPVTEPKTLQPIVKLNECV